MWRRYLFLRNTTLATVCSVGYMPKYTGGGFPANTLPESLVGTGTAPTPYQPLRLGSVRLQYPFLTLRYVRHANQKTRRIPVYPAEHNAWIIASAHILRRHQDEAGNMPSNARE